MSLEVYLVRHGKTVFNTVGRLQGWSDSPLTAEGRAVAEKLGRSLACSGISFNAAFSSISPRAFDTARLILQHAGQADLPLTTIENLREYCFGGLEGELAEIVHEKVRSVRGLPNVQTWLATYRNGTSNLLAESASTLDPLQLAETESQFVARLSRGLEELVQRAPTQGRVLLVSHGMAITAILKSIDAGSTLYQSVPNASVSRLNYADGQWRVLGVGDTSLGGG